MSDVWRRLAWRLLRRSAAQVDRSLAKARQRLQGCGVIWWRCGAGSVKPGDAVCLMYGVAWLGACYAGDRSLAEARQRLQGCGVIWWRCALR
ncbi:hypothetical protein EMIT048CA2_110179 [Pseudomonas chlororaphis]